MIYEVQKRIKNKDYWITIISSFTAETALIALIDKCNFNSEFTKDKMFRLVIDGKVCYI